MRGSRVRTFDSYMVCRHSRPASTPRAPSSGPPFGTVSMCEPVTTAGPPLPRRPKVFPASSTQVLSPASFMRSRSQARASSCAGLQQDRVMPLPSGFLPNRARVSRWARRRGSEMARGPAMAAGSIPQRFTRENPTCNAFLTLFAGPSYHGTELSFSRPHDSAAKPAPQGGCMDFALTPEQTSFRDEVRSWLKKNLPKDWTDRMRIGSDVPRPEVYDFLRKWQRQMYEAGFVGVTWPKDYGGRGLTFMEEMILHEEIAITKAPPVLNILAIGMAGPTIIAYGTEEQKRRYPPKILSCEEIWCQGYSEPNAGSDLAALQTRAVRDGEYYVINGQKVWTSLAHVADWMMLLARTDPGAPKHKGITYFLLDMHLPGVTVKPLRQITGDAEFNEVFFDGVRVHDSQVLGGVNNGWAVGMTTLMYERLALGFGLQMRLRIALDGLVELARRMEKHGRVIVKDPVMRQKIAQLWIDTECLKYTGARAVTKLLRGEIPGPEASTGKMGWVETHQRLQELAMEIEGPYSQLMKGSEWAMDGGSWEYTFLRSRANSIEGGTTEIQKNIIAERLLGLPKD